MNTIPTIRAAFRKTPVLVGFAAAFLLLGAILWLAGMKSAPTVAGMVQLDGQPLTQGSIRLVPVEGTPGSDGGAAIRQGKYRIEKGLTEGKYKVEIQGTRLRPGKKARNPFDSDYGNAEETIPFAELDPATITVGAGLNTRDFALKEKKRP